MLKCENLPRTNSTKSETQFLVAKIQRNEHTPGFGVDEGVVGEWGGEGKRGRMQTTLR